MGGYEAVSMIEDLLRRVAALEAAANPPAPSTMNDYDNDELRRFRAASRHARRQNVIGIVEQAALPFWASRWTRIRLREALDNMIEHIKSDS